MSAAAVGVACNAVFVPSAHTLVVLYQNSVDIVCGVEELETGSKGIA